MTIRIEFEHLMFIVAHDDDPILMASGLLRRAIDDGKRVSILCMNSSDATGGSPQELASAYGELRNCNVKALNLPRTMDMRVEVAGETTRLLMEELREGEPDLVVTNSRSDVHVDHVNTATMVQQALFHGYIWGRCTRPALALEGEIYTPFGEAQIILPADFDLKSSVMAKFPSQVADFDWLNLVSHLNRFRACQAHRPGDYAEAFRILGTSGACKWT